VGNTCSDAYGPAFEEAFEGDALDRSRWLPYCSSGSTCALVAERVRRHLSAPR
jgi:hypothetical protein